MQVISYKDYLQIFSQHHGQKTSVPKITLSFVVVLLIVFSISLGISSYKNQSIAPQNQEISFLENANANFFKTQQSMDDLFSSFQVAGAKVEKIDTLKESTPTPGYFITLGEAQKAIAKIKSTQESLAFQKNSIQKEGVPPIYTTLSTEINEYFDEVETFLNKMETQHVDLKNLLIAAGPNFYLPVLSDETVWKTQDKDKIKIYYKNKKEEAEKSMLNFAQVPTDPALKTFKETQISYYQLLINVSDNILKVLAKEDVQAPDNATTVEEAYQVLAGAKRENEVLSAKLLEEKLSLTDSDEYFAAANRLKNRQKVIESAFSAGNLKTVAPKEDESVIEDFFKNFFLNFKQRALQTD